MVRLRPSGEWEIMPNDPNSLVWRGPGDPPTATEILESIKQIETENINLASRKIWETVSDFWSEFSNEEKYAIEVSQDQTLIVLRADLKLWLKDVWSDDPRIVMGLTALVSAGIINETRKAEIIAK